MAKQLTINNNGRVYTLEFNRETVMAMERLGFDVNHVMEKPMTMLPMLFTGAFAMHHKALAQETVDGVYKSIKGKDKLLGALVTMYRDTVDTLFDEPEEDEGNAVWETNF